VERGRREEGSRFARVRVWRRVALMNVGFEGKGERREITGRRRLVFEEI